MPCVVVWVQVWVAALQRWEVFTVSGQHPITGDWTKMILSHFVFESEQICSVSEVSGQGWLGRAQWWNWKAWKEVLHIFFPTEHVHHRAISPFPGAHSPFQAPFSPVQSEEALNLTWNVRGHDLMKADIWQFSERELGMYASAGK